MNLGDYGGLFDVFFFYMCVIFYSWVFDKAMMPKYFGETVITSENLK